MPRINLIPIKAAQRAEGAKKELLTMLLLLILLFGALYGWYAIVDREVSAERSKIGKVQQQIAQLATDLERIETLKSEAKVLQAKADVIDRLQRQRIGPAMMLSDLADIITQEKRVWLKSMGDKVKKKGKGDKALGKQKKTLSKIRSLGRKKKKKGKGKGKEEDKGPQKLTLVGGAMEHEDISHFQTSLSLNSKFFTKVELGGVKTAQEDNIRILEWKITFVPDYSSD
jgi:type IV pilus assembly protein PilN